MELDTALHGFVGVQASTSAQQKNTALVHMCVHDEWVNDTKLSDALGVTRFQTSSKGMYILQEPPWAAGTWLCTATSADYSAVKSE